MRTIWIAAWIGFCVPTLTYAQSADISCPQALQMINSDDNADLEAYAQQLFNQWNSAAAANGQMPVSPPVTGFTGAISFWQKWCEQPGQTFDSAVQFTYGLYRAGE